MKHLESAFNGKNKWWLYLVMILAVVLGGQFIGSIPIIVAVVVAFVKTGAMPAMDAMDLTALGVSSSVAIGMMLFVFAAMLIMFALLVKPIHGRTFKQTINGRSRIRWNRVWVGIAVWGVFSLVSVGIDLMIDGGNYVWQFDFRSFLSLLVVVVLLLPFQTSCEEVLFRGYLAQGLGVWTKNRWVVLIVVSLLFGLLHSSNPEIKEFGFWLMMPQYVVMGLFLGLISILDDGIELALGVHFINNAMGVLVVTHDSSALKSDALLKMIDASPSVVDLGVFVLLSALAYMVLQRIYKWDFRVLNRRIEREIPPVYVTADEQPEQQA